MTGRVISAICHPGTSGLSTASHRFSTHSFTYFHTTQLLIGGSTGSLFELVTEGSILIEVSAGYGQKVAVFFGPMGSQVATLFKMHTMSPVRQNIFSTRNNCVDRLHFQV